MAGFCVVLFFPLMLVAALLMALLPALNVAFNVAAAVMLAFHLLLFVLLLVVRSRLTKAGHLGRDYAEQFSGWRHWSIRIAGWVLVLGAVWEGLMSLLCLVWLIFRPLRFFL